MRRTLHLRSQQLPFIARDSQDHSIFALRHGPSDLSRPFDCLNQIAYAHILNRPVGAICHQDGGSPSHALHIVGAPLVLHPIAHLLDAAQLHHLALG